MAAFKELPPKTTGNTAADIYNLRDYLIRMARSLQQAQTAATSASVVSTAAGSGGVSAATQAAIAQNKAELKALITKTAHTLEQYTDSTASTLVAKSEYGTYLQANEAYIQQTAEGVIDTYHFTESITAATTTANAAAAAITSYETVMNGEIRRGIVQDPESGNYVTGIAISQNLVTGSACGPDDPHNPGDGNTYYYLASGQTFGLYTSTGWQFWVDGYKKGWYNSSDGMLHITDVYIEKTLQIGEKVQFKVDPDGRFGIKLLT